MYEDIGRLIGEGFSTWRNNLTLCIPFLLSVIFSALAVIPLIAVVIVTLGITNIESQSSEQLVSKMMDSLPSLFSAFLVTILLVTIVSAFFEAGAIGMSRQATEEGKAQIGSMWATGRKDFLSMFLLSILTGLITLAGFVFLLPGIFMLPQPIMIENIPSDTQAIGMLALGILILIVYATILSIILAIAPYALVIENIGPVDAIKASLRFFAYNKFDVFVLWIVVVAISIGLEMIGSSVTVGSNITAQPLSLLTGLVNLLILTPLSTVWWTRLYMSRTGKMLYKEDVSGDLYGTQ